MDTLKKAREELAADLKAKQAAADEAKDKLTKFDSIFGSAAPAKKKPGPKPKAATEAAPAKPKGKPGPKPKGKPAAETPAKPKGKPGPKPKAEKASKGETSKAAGKSRAAEGRRAVARGERPPIKQAMAQVMGGDTCNPAMVAERLAAKGWTPAAADPKTYCGYMLSSNKDMFERVPAKGRGFYRVKDGVSTAASTPAAAPAPVATPAPAPAAKAEATEAKKEAPKEAPKAAVNGAGKQSTDEILKEAGFTDLTGPFGA